MRSPSSRPAVEIAQLSKIYRLPTTERELTLAEQLLRKARKPWARAGYRELPALSDVCLTVEAGEAVGLIGRNGAGKSTLLKVLSRITPPTAGTVRLHGRVGSLLEVGTGFHGELTGRENIFLSGAILGMKRAEISRQFDAIVEFAGVAKFLDLPVKRYSSGMYVRLAFAVAAHMDTEILLVDEVLAVGDSDFQQLSAAKMRDVVASGRTVILVSHQMRTISDICQRAVVLEHGTIAFDGSVPEAIAHHIAAVKEQGQTSRTTDAVGAPLVISRARPTHPSFLPDQAKAITLDVNYDGHTHVDRYFASLVIRSSDGTPVAHCDSNAVGQWFRPITGTQQIHFELAHPWLQPGEYYVDASLCNAGVLDSVQHACWFTVDCELPYPMPPALEIARRDLVLPHYGFNAARTVSSGHDS